MTRTKPKKKPKPQPKPKARNKAAPKLCVPDFECKVFLDATKVLDVEFRPVAQVAKLLRLSDSNRKMSMQFIDARPVQIHAQGWDIRMRKFEDEEDQYEMTFKRRYPLGSGSMNDALAAAAADGFDADELEYDPQLEWGFGKRTLSVSRKKPFKLKGHAGMNLPPVETVRNAIKELLPGKLDRWNKPGWARGVLRSAHLYGPVLGHRWTGRWNGPDLDFEVWLIKTESGQGFEPVVELSFKARKEKDAAANRKKLMVLVRKAGLLLESDVLKTEMILNRY